MHFRLRFSLQPLVFRVLLPSTVYLLLTTALIVPVKARDCNKPTDFTFGNLVSAFINPDSDCSLDYFKNPDNPVFREWLKYSEVSCIRNPMLDAKTWGDWEEALKDGELDEYEEESSGEARTGLQPILPNIGLNPKVVEKNMAEYSLSPALSSITTSYDQFNIGQVEAGMRATNSETRAEYLQKYSDGGCYFESPDGSGFINDFCEAGNARWQTEEEQFRYQLKPQGRDRDIKCAQGTAENQVHCQNSYNIGTTTTNVEILKDFLPAEPEEYPLLDPATKNKLRASVQRTKAQTQLCVALVPNINRTYEYLGNDGEYWSYDLSDTNVDYFQVKEVKIACGNIQGLVGTIDGLEEEYRVYNPAEVKPGTTIAQEIQTIKELSKTPGEDDMDWPPPSEGKYYARDSAILEKLKKVGSSCRSPQDNYLQFSGGNTDTSTMGDTNWLFKLFGLQPKKTAQEGDAINPYSIYFIAPGDFTVLEQMSGRNAHSPYRAYLTLQESQVLDNAENSVDIPWFLPQNQASENKRKIGWWWNEKERYDRDTDTTETINVQEPVTQEYSGGGQLAMHQRGGQQAQNFLELAFQKLKPLDDPERIDDCNLYGGLLKKIPRLAGILGLVGGVADNLSKTFDDCRPNVESLAAATPPISTTGACKQWLFENNNYNKVLSAASATTCNGKSLNPYWAMAIALNENGALMSNDPEGRSTAHFGCDPFGSAGYDTTIEAKLKCMVNTLRNYCVSGKSDAESLAAYGYPAGYEFGPLQVLMGSDSLTPSQYPPLWGGGDQGNLVSNLLGTDWAAYYAGAMDEFCPGATSIE